MADEKPLTKANLAAALKEAGVATKDDVKREVAGLRDEIRDVVHEELTEFHANMTKPEMDKLRQEMKAGFKDVDARLG